jgi:hypothetical protein
MDHIIEVRVNLFFHPAFQFGLRQKQGDAAVLPTASRLPSVILEVGDSESLTQLKIDARLWLEHMLEVSQYLFSFVPTHCWNFLQVQLVILLSIDAPIAPHPTLPRITIELWRGLSPFNAQRPTAATQPRVAHMVLTADWTHTATPLYLLLSDIFRGQVPAAYGNNNRVHLDTVAWRQGIIDSW